MTAWPVVKPHSLPRKAPGNWLEATDLPGLQARTAMESAEMAAELAIWQQNRRAAPRLDVDEDARLLLVEHGSTVSCRIVDISLSGCRLRTKERFTAGSMVCVEVAFKVRGLAFRFSGMTQWTDGRHLVGIRFAGVSARRREELVEALCEVEAENAAKAAQQAAEQRAAEEQAAALEHAAAVKSAERAAQRRPLILIPAPGMAAQQVAEKLDPEGGGNGGARGTEGGRGPQRRVLVAGVEDGGFNPRIKPTELPRALAPEFASPSQAKLAPRERRVQSREEVDTKAVIFLINIASRLRGRILDLSPGGCRIRADERFPVGIYTRVETEFRLGGLPFRLGGVIQAIHDRRTVGIRFLDMSSRKREQVTQLIEEIRQMREQGIGNRE
jgi:c-di-GMP-binding flagellar brake protein YcgR